MLILRLLKSWVKMMESCMHIEQAEVWLIEFYPKVGSEITKKRPGLVVSHNVIGRLPLKTVVPITDWKEQYKDYPWMVKVKNDAINGLGKRSAIDCFQIKNLSHDRFVQKLGEVDERVLQKVHATIVKTLNPMYAIR